MAVVVGVLIIVGVVLILVLAMLLVTTAPTLVAVIAAVSTALAGRRSGFHPMSALAILAAPLRPLTALAMKILPIVVRGIMVRIRAIVMRLC